MKIIISDEIIGVKNGSISNYFRFSIYLIVVLVLIYAFFRFAIIPSMEVVFEFLVKHGMLKIH